VGGILHLGIPLSGGEGKEGRGMGVSIGYSFPMLRQRQRSFPRGVRQTDWHKTLIQDF
jgi:hypothetical protein